MNNLIMFLYFERMCKIDRSSSWSCITSSVERFFIFRYLPCFENEVFRSRFRNESLSKFAFANLQIIFLPNWYVVLYRTKFRSSEMCFCSYKIVSHLDGEFTYSHLRILRIVRWKKGVLNSFVLKVCKEFYKVDFIKSRESSVKN